MRNHEKHRNNIGIVNEVTLFFVIGFVMFSGVVEVTHWLKLG